MNYIDRMASAFGEGRGAFLHDDPKESAFFTARTLAWQRMQRFPDLRLCISPWALDTALDAAVTLVPTEQRPMLKGLTLAQVPLAEKSLNPQFTTNIVAFSILFDRTYARKEMLNNSRQWRGILPKEHRAEYDSIVAENPVLATPRPWGSEESIAQYLPHTPYGKFILSNVPRAIQAQRDPDLLASSVNGFWYSYNLYTPLRVADSLEMAQATDQLELFPQAQLTETEQKTPSLTAALKFGVRKGIDEHFEGAPSISIPRALWRESNQLNREIMRLMNEEGLPREEAIEDAGKKYSLEARELAACGWSGVRLDAPIKGGEDEGEALVGDFITLERDPSHPMALEATESLLHVFRTSEPSEFLALRSLLVGEPEQRRLALPKVQAFLRKTDPSLCEELTPAVESLTQQAVVAADQVPGYMDYTKDWASRQRLAESISRNAGR